MARVNELASVAFCELIPNPNAPGLPLLREDMERNREAMAGLLADFAEFEREILRERLKAGIVQSRKEGRPHGRPPTASRKAGEVLRLTDERVCRSEIARRLGIGRTSVRRILAEGGIDLPSNRS